MSIHNLIRKMRNLILVYSLAWFTTLKRILSSSIHSSTTWSYPLEEVV